MRSPNTSFVPSSGFPAEPEENLNSDAVAAIIGTHSAASDPSDPHPRITCALVVRDSRAFTFLLCPFPPGVTCWRSAFACDKETLPLIAAALDDQRRLATIALRPYPPQPLLPPLLYSGPAAHYSALQTYWPAPVIHLDPSKQEDER